MNKWIVALCAGALMAASAVAAETKSGDMLDHMILSASGDSWTVWGAPGAVRDDAGVKGGKITRVTAKKGANPWDTQASTVVPQAVQKGDIILVAYYARVETPPAGAATANIPSASIGLNKAPYTSFASEPSAPNGTWGVYYTSGVAEADHPKGSLNFGIQLAAADQVVDLGPVFMFNLGPNWDLTKIPHNKLAAAAPAAPAAPAAASSPETAYAADLAKLRTKLPVKGVLINDPAQIYSYGPDITETQIAAADITGGKAKRIVTNKAGAHPYDDGASSPISAAIKKGDVVFAAVLVRATEPAPGAQAALIPELGVHLAGAPYTAIATSSATAPKGQWTWVYASGVATTDYASGTTGFAMQLGGSAQTLDIGAVYVLNLGPGVDTNKLPNNFGKPF
jgi:hypothetical protein